MAKRVRQDISQNVYEEKKVLKHVDVEEVCEENKCRELKVKKRRLDEEDK